MRSFSAKTWFLWIPFGGWNLDLKGYDAVTGGYSEGSTGNAGVAVALGIDTSREDEFFLHFGGPNKKRVRIYYGSNDEHMREILDLIKEATGFRIDRV